MSDAEIPRELTAGGHNWEYFTYDGGNRHQWYRAMTDEEVRDASGGRYDGADDFDFELMWVVESDYPVYMIELQERADDTYVVDANRTRFGPNRPGMVSGLGGDYRVEGIETVEEAMATVREFARSISD